MTNRRQRTLQSLQGLSVGDAFGEMFFTQPQRLLTHRQPPPGPWRWTDDTHMALSIVEVLLSCGEIDEDQLAKRFAGRYLQDPYRGYGGGARHLLTLYSQGADWRVEAPRLFNGGSYGNGGAMRAAPVGAYFAGDPERAAIEALRAASVTHAHPEGQAGAIGVAVAAAIMTTPSPPSGAGFLEQILPFVPEGRTQAGIVAATHIPAPDHGAAIATLGTGHQIAAFDTVPYCLWVAAHHAPDFETALWTTAAGLGDVDTTCAIVGGITALTTGVPETWSSRREPLPPDFLEGAF